METENYDYELSALILKGRECINRFTIEFILLLLYAGIRIRLKLLDPDSDNHRQVRMG